MLKLALFVLNARANDGAHPGECWASIETLTESAGMRSTRSFQYALRELERLGCIERREPGYKGRAAATYVIKIGQLHAIAAPEDQRKFTFKSADSAADDVTDGNSVDAEAASASLPPPADAPPPSDAPPASGPRELEPSIGRDSDTWAIWLALYRTGLRARWGDDAEYPIDRVSSVLREQLCTRTLGLARKYARNNETLAESVARCTTRLVAHYLKRDRAPLIQRHHPLEYIDGDIDVIFADVGRELAAKRAAEQPADVRYVDVPVFTASELAAAGKSRHAPVRRTLTTSRAAEQLLAALAPTGTGGDS